MSRFRNCESPQLTRLSSQINDLKRKIAGIQTRQTEKIQKHITKTSFKSNKSADKLFPKQKSPKQHKPEPKISKLSQFNMIKNNQAAEMQSDVLSKLQFFQKQFQQNGKRIHQFIKKLISQLKHIEEVLMQKLKQTKDSVTNVIDKDIAKFIKEIKKIEKEKNSSDYQNLKLLKDKIITRLFYDTTEIDAYLQNLEFNISRVNKNLDKQNPLFKQQIRQQLKQELKPKSNPKIDVQQSRLLDRDTPSIQRFSKASSPRESSSFNYLHYLQQQKKQYNSTKQLLKL